MSCFSQKGNIDLATLYCNAMTNLRQCTATMTTLLFMIALLPGIYFLDLLAVQYIHLCLSTKVKLCSS